MIGITVRIIPAFYLWVPLVIEQGDPEASISINRASIRFPEPFDQHGLTHACRTFITTAVRHAVDTDGFQRSITWPESSSHHHRRSA
jgi:hypothetical protein